MYNLFKFFKWNPKKYYDADSGEKVIIKAFLEQYLEERDKEDEDLENSY